MFRFGSVSSVDDPCAPIIINPSNLSRWQCSACVPKVTSHHVLNGVTPLPVPLLGIHWLKSLHLLDISTIKYVDLRNLRVLKTRFLLNMPRNVFP